uniref:Uncharacterized protein n=1 Tax=Anguilla anguilla TaxID=7936 RepID=A0A0E9U3M9_ANGAN
MDTKTYHNYFT